MKRFEPLAFISFGIAAGCVAATPSLEEGTPAPAGDTDGAGQVDAGSGSDDTPVAFEPVATLDHVYQAQQTSYWCGPGSTRIALSTVTSALPTQQALANELPTSTNGTDYIGLVVNTLNRHVGSRYVAVEMPHDPPSPEERDRLWNDIVLSISAGHGLVANIVAPPNNHPPGYPNETIYHYIALVGYNADTREVYVADPANFEGNNHYWLSFDQTATLIPPKGYATYRCGVGRTQGEIDKRYQTLGGCAGFLGTALTDERITPDGVGKYNVFVNGSIYWSPSTGAHEVHGAIREKWKAVGWEAGPLGYPTSDEYDVANGRASDFEHGTITWNKTSDTTTVTQK
jgi:hypothetical protein